MKIQTVLIITGILFAFASVCSSPEENVKQEETTEGNSDANQPEVHVGSEEKTEDGEQSVVANDATTSLIDT